MAIHADIEPPSSSTQEQTNNVSKTSSNQNHNSNIVTRFLAQTGLFLQNNKIARTLRIKRFASDESEQKTAKKIRDFLVGSNYLPHFVLITLGTVVSLSNLHDRSVSADFYNSLVYVDPAVESSIAQGIDQYTPLVANDSESIQKVRVATSADGFVSTIGSVATEITNREDPLPDNSSTTVDYVVRQGDTLTGLGWKFEVKIATLKYVNNLDDVNALRPGIKLKIPPRGYEVSKDAIAKKDQEKQTKLAAAKRTTVTRGANIARAAEYSDAEPDGSTGHLIVPINHNGISRGLSSGHTGIDYRANIGTPVMAADDGVVMQITGGWSGGYGLQVLINHGNGVVTRYAHLSAVDVSIGQHVSQGQTVAHSGNSGRSTGPHLHFEKIVNGHPVNPF